jgi:hypothetical protein
MVVEGKLSMCQNCGCARCHESVPQQDDAQNQQAESALEQIQMMAMEEGEFSAPPADAPGAVRRMHNPQLTLQQRQQAALQLQRQHGNAFVQRMLAGEFGGRGIIQRWAVGLKADAECNDVVSYINANSPYKPKWATCKAQLKYDDSAGYTATPGSEKGSFDVTAPGAKIVYSSGPTIDMPTWSPTNPTTSKAWTAAMSQLQAHEDQHKNVFDSDQTTIESTMQYHSETVKAADEATAKATGKSRFFTQAGKELAVVQKNQNAVDSNGAGCAAMVDCSVDDDKTSAQGGMMPGGGTTDVASGVD